MHGASENLRLNVFLDSLCNSKWICFQPKGHWLWHKSSRWDILLPASDLSKINGNISKCHLVTKYAVILLFASRALHQTKNGRFVFLLHYLLSIPGHALLRLSHGLQFPPVHSRLKSAAVKPRSETTLPTTPRYICFVKLHQQNAVHFFATNGGSMLWFVPVKKLRKKLSSM